MHLVGGHGHEHGDRRAGRPGQEADRQEQAAEELGRAHQVGERQGRLQADLAEEPGGAFDVAAEPAEQLLRAVGHQEQAGEKADHRVGQPGQAAVERRQGRND